MKANDHRSHCTTYIGGPCSCATIIAAIEADRRGRTFSPTEIDRAVEAELARVVAWLRDKGHSYAYLLAAAIANRDHTSQDIAPAKICEHQTHPGPCSVCGDMS